MSIDYFPVPKFFTSSSISSGVCVCRTTETIAERGYSANTIYLPMAGHVLGLQLKPHPELDLEKDLDCAIEYLQAKGVGEFWFEVSRNGLYMFRRFLRIERGLGEETKTKPFNSARVTAGLPRWLVNELDRHQRLMQRNWRDARMEQNIRRYWSGYLRM